MDQPNRSASVTNPVAATNAANSSLVTASCPVAEQCLAHALANRETHGIWGGLSEDERRALKRRNARLRARTLPGQEAAPTEQVKIERIAFVVNESQFMTITLNFSVLAFTNSEIVFKSFPIFPTHI